MTIEELKAEWERAMMIPQKDIHLSDRLLADFARKYMDKLLAVAAAVKNLSPTCPCCSLGVEDWNLGEAMDELQGEK